MDISDTVAMRANAALNNTSASQTSAQSVTGQTAFWAMVALALNAMSQDSTYGTMILRSTHGFERSLTPHRSSPVICLLDSTLELAALAKVLWQSVRPSPTAEDTGSDGPSFNVRELFHANPGLLPGLTEASSFLPFQRLLDAISEEPGTVEAANEKVTGGAFLTMRVVVFVLGVLPQAIKLFGMRGIPRTQACAAVFLFSALVKALASAFGSRHEDELLRITAWVRKLAKPMRLTTLLHRVLWALHAVGFMFIWRSIHDNITFTLSNDDSVVLRAADFFPQNTPILYLAWHLLRLLYSLFWSKTPWFFSWYDAWYIPLLLAADDLQSMFRTPDGARLRLDDWDTKNAWESMNRQAGLILKDLYRPFFLGLLGASASFLIAKTLSSIIDYVMHAGQEFSASAESVRRSGTETSAVGTSSRDCVQAHSSNDTPEASSLALPNDYDALIVTLLLTSKGPDPIPDNSIVSTRALSGVLKARSWRLTDAEQGHIIAKWRQSNHLLETALVDATSVSTPTSDLFFLPDRKIHSALFHSTMDLPRKGLAQLQANSDPFVRSPSVLKRCFNACWIVTSTSVRLLLQAATLLMWHWMMMVDCWSLPVLAYRYARVWSGPDGHVLWITFAIFNLLTTALCYLVVFDGRGTYNPGWTYVFG